jgi:hypothetical protein
MTLAFRDHEGFQRAALAMTACGAAAGLAAHLLGRLWPGAGSPTALLGGGAGSVTGWAVLALLALGVALALRAPEASRRWTALGAVVGAAVLLLALRAGLQILSAQELAAWPRWLVAAASGGAASLIAIGALLPRHVRVARDPVAAAVAGLPAGLDGEVRDLVERGRAVWTELHTRLAVDPASQDLVRDGVLRMVDVARRSADVPVDLASSGERIARRAAELDARVAAATDEIAAGQYRQARAALDDQQRDLDAIRTGRERLVARMHNYLAGLERFRLAVIKHQAASASQLAVEARPLLGEVAELAAELD